ARASRPAGQPGLAAAEFRARRRLGHHACQRAPGPGRGGPAARPAARIGRRVACNPGLGFSCCRRPGPGGLGAGDEHGSKMYFTERGIDELEEQRGEDQVSLAWLAQRFRQFVDLNPESETAVDRLAGWLAVVSDDE